MSSKKNESHVRRFRVIEATEGLIADEIFYEFANRPGLFYSESSPRFLKFTSSNFLKLVVLADMDNVLENKIKFLKPVKNKRSPLQKNYKMVQYERNMIMKANQLIEAESSALVKRRRVRISSPVRIFY